MRSVTKFLESYDIKETGVKQKRKKEKKTFLYFTQELGNIMTTNERDDK